MNPESFITNSIRLTEIAENAHNHLLDRIDVYLELSQLHQWDAYNRARYVTKARDLIRDEHKRGS